MLQEVSELIGLQVYTKDGIFLGNVNNVILDLEKHRIEGVFIASTNPLLVEGARSVSVPFRWIRDVGDIILLRYFPSRITVRKDSLEENLLE